MKNILIAIMSLFVIMQLSLSHAHATNNPRNIYEVKSGDALWKIAATYQTSASDLKRINGLQSDLLFVGQKIRVPVMYEIQPGDTLWLLSQSFNSTISSIKAANKLQSNLLYVGQVIRIPPKKLQMEGQFVLMTREEFKDWIFNHKFSRKVNLIQQHHTYQPNYQSFNGSNHFALLKGMKEYHVNGMKWSDISQQLTTFPDGTVAVGRSFNTPPEGSFGLQNEAAMKRIEDNALAIENLGSFDKGDNQMTAEQRETILTVTALLMIKYGLTPSVDSVTYHHWWDINTGERVLDHGAGHAVKSCPGTGFFGGNSTASAEQNFYPLVLQKMNEIRASLQ
ncbi:peptidoglycan recognition protein family protein [Pontibacillus chungwhensis]|uniref:Autolysin n=2 Tax=Pontibacillus TaxID=289201 RepID=A0ABY8V0P5_9BACI|nr:LysM peptidoglycan-binding domain-containing protein [Pontibacillus chungwhensis]MCD5322218.1 LysM peptidoglycan-binding domain-containing protein [Pontibacillus sp. HN14]WIF99512.1 LysM peptidoglycan-binding domain-containing protein [Pontibacillus chungwhensis]